MKMLHSKDSIRKKLKTNQASVGSWMQIPDDSVAEIMGHAGYDWVAVDMEHGAISRSDLPGLFRALASNGTLPFARLAGTQAFQIKAALDSGAQGLIFPMIENPGQLEAAIRNAHYPPSGDRGIGFCRANLFGKYFETAFNNENNPIIVAQIEHQRAVENIDGILNVDGLDAIMIGPYDLSGSMEMTGEFDRPEFQDMIGTILKKSRQYGIAAGLHVVAPSENQLQEKIAEGYQFIAYGIDAVFLYHAADNPNLMNLK